MMLGKSCSLCICKIDSQHGGVHECALLRNEYELIAANNVLLLWNTSANEVMFMREGHVYQVIS